MLSVCVREREGGRVEKGIERERRERNRERERRERFEIFGTSDHFDNHLRELSQKR